MNLMAVRTVVKQIGLWSLLAGVVAGLTVLFTLLATLVCAVLTGLMMGTSQRWKRQLVPVSLVFPLVTLLLGQAVKADVGSQQRLSAAIISLGAFWVSYFITLLVIRLEDKPSPAAQVTTWSTTPERNTALSPAPAVEADAGVGVTGPLDLRDLQGIWWCENHDKQGIHQRRSIEIAGDRFTLRIVNPGRRAQVVTEGYLKVDRVGVRDIHLVVAAPHQSGGASS